MAQDRQDRTDSKPKKKKIVGGVEEVGKLVKKWRGHVEVTIIDPATGSKKRHHETVDLGLVADLTKTEAKDKLAEIKTEARKAAAKTRSNGTVLPGGAWISPDQLTFEWFWRNRYRPAKLGAWEDNTRISIDSVMNVHVLPRIGKVLLRGLTKHDLQMHLNEVAEKGGRGGTMASKSLVHKVRTYVNDILEEALDQELIEKNPARRLERPRTKRVCQDFATPEQLRAFWDLLIWRDRLIIRIYTYCAFRRGELQALRIRSFHGDRFVVDENWTLDKLKDSTKTTDERQEVAIPPGLRGDIRKWIEVSGPRVQGPDAFLFAQENGRPLPIQYLLKKHWKRLAAQVGIPNLTIQMLRRSCATHLQSVEGYSPKDAQAQLRHASPAVTMGTYTKSLKGEVMESVERLEELFEGKGAVQ